MKLLWLDIESTGLDPNKDEILEVAAITASLERPFDAIQEYEAVRGLDEHDILARNIDVHPVVREMHKKNGLWKACSLSATQLEEIESRLLSMVDGIGPEDRENQTTLAGSCVSFDHGFVKRWMPTFARYLHYRVLDVSSVMLFARSCGMPRPPKAEAHRAMADVRESMANLRRCAEWFEGSEAYHGIRDATDPKRP